MAGCALRSSSTAACRARRALTYHWYDTPNIHLCTIADFVALAREMGAKIERALALDEKGRSRDMQAEAWGPNLFADGAIFLLKKD